MDFYQSLGGLVLGSRLRRVSEYFITEINKVYQSEGIDFEAGWFPLFYLLGTKGQLSIRAVSDTLLVSHSASSQLVSQFRKNGIVKISRSAEDRRKQLVSLTENGQDLFRRMEPLWATMSDAIQHVITANPVTASLLSAISALEVEFERTPLSERIINQPKLIHHDE